MTMASTKATRNWSGLEGVHRLKQDRAVETRELFWAELVLECAVELFKLLP